MMKVFAAVLVLSLSACANRPETIHASFVSHEKFTGLECSDLAAKKSAASNDLLRLSNMQDAVATQDAMGVFFLLIPVSKMFGNDQEAAIAKAKGEIEAMETAQIKNGCGYERMVKVPEVVRTDKRVADNGAWPRSPGQ